ncbi:hypothetical protein JAAARDRAFT_601085 [Jaapia argillacea MUCL 33604]|uniref:Uncharacterized protein n=1 Tax=Jaapia argillacea MUCL 33604 TaxID=933084 RepID=A0A067PZL7_9AGAM|nr:hypothetical protein JAAARDRAFT_601085 [Jaapia argillacea MUCL 33604]
MPTTPAKVTRFPDRAIPSHNSLPVDMPSASRQAYSLKQRNTFVPPGYRNPPRPTGQHHSARPPPFASSRIPIATSYLRPGYRNPPRPTGQHYSVRPPPVASSRIPIATFYQRPSMIQHTRSSGTPGSSDTSPFDRRPPVYGRARGMGKTSDNRSSHSSQTTGSSIHSLSRDRHPRRSPK